MAQVAVCSQINTKHINTVWAERTVVECSTVGASRSGFRRLRQKHMLRLTLAEGAEEDIWAGEEESDKKLKEMT